MQKVVNTMKCTHDSKMEICKGVGFVIVGVGVGIPTYQEWVCSLNLLGFKKAVMVNLVPRAFSHTGGGKRPWGRGWVMVPLRCSAFKGPQGIGYEPNKR